MLTRTLTPDRWLTSDARRARWDSSATISSMKSGSSMTRSVSSKRARSWAMMRSSCSMVRG